MSFALKPMRELIKARWFLSDSKINKFGLYGLRLRQRKIKSPTMNNQSQTYSIAELASEFAITPRAIRHYQDKGLLTPERQGSQRIYHNRDKVRLQLVLRGKRLGFSLDEIGEIISMYDLPSGKQKQTQLLLKKITQRRQALHQQQQDIQTMLQELTKLESKLNQN